MSAFSPLPYRQVHLDFHTSEHLENIGRDFDVKQFQDALRHGHVNSITSFGTCHHGWCYYPSKHWDMHPNMSEPLLPKMLEAAKEIDVQMPIYLTVGWNERIARLHPEWIVKDIDGNDCDLQPDDGGPRQGWRRICLNTPYLDQLVLISKEIVELYNPIGIFYDIVWEKPCYCDSCRAIMRERGISDHDTEAQKALATEIYTNYQKTIADAVWSMKPDTRIYHNGSDKKGRTDVMPYTSHYEIESLPTTNWCGGYEHFPQNARYFKHKGLDYLGMTGKFHESWGEFGGYKHPVALQYETMRMLMLGGKCSIGDQMLPEGLLDAETYRIIGEAYKLVEEKEPWCEDATNVAEIGVLCPSAVAQDGDLEEAEIGACMILSETQALFDMIDHESDFSTYKLIILPDEVPVNAELKTKIEAFLSSGGSILASGESGLEIGSFALDYGVAYKGPSEWYIDFTKATDELSENLVKSPYFNYLPGPQLELGEANTLAHTVAPHFNRTYERFCSHGNTPPGPDAGYPSVVQKGSIIYIGPKVFTMYREKAMRLHRDLVNNCIKRLLPEPSLKADLPSGALATLNQLPNHSHVLHLLFANPIPRGEINVIEDVIPLLDVKIQVKLPSVESVKLAPEGTELEFEYDGGFCVFTCPKIELHQMIELS